MFDWSEARFEEVLVNSLLDLCKSHQRWVECEGVLHPEFLKPTLSLLQGCGSKLRRTEVTLQQKLGIVRTQYRLASSLMTERCGSNLRRNTWARRCIN